MKNASAVAAVVCVHQFASHRDTLPQGGLWSLQTSMLQSSQQVSVQGPYVVPCFTATCAWMRVKGAARVVVANPNSGPGTQQDATGWLRLAGEMRAAGTLALGYVYTSTGSRNATTVKSEISKYYQWYPSLAGIFIDQVRCKPASSTRRAAQQPHMCAWR